MFLNEILLEFQAQTPLTTTDVGTSIFNYVDGDFQLRKLSKSPAKGRLQTVQATGLHLPRPVLSHGNITWDSPDVARPRLRSVETNPFRRVYNSIGINMDKMLSHN